MIPGHTSNLTNGFREVVRVASLLKASGAMSSNDVSVVLVHGAWADGSSWSRVITPLATLITGPVN
jgi:hypothetical protein